MMYYDRKLGRVLMYAGDDLVLIIGNDGRLLHYIHQENLWDLEGRVEKWNADRVINGFLGGVHGLKYLFDNLFGAIE